ncbi:octopine/nopaline transport system substrate-binding protein [Mesorhizobium soli]|jgi:octopine/nopaline transport system substrate-binding protein|uniref:transporter substrate-binding domain-containing protein n=1 Tax=Pseudaminobacter soli (ex Li et al. 2025) TaxID=1295366 RepID=UPI0024770F2B|nr:transporter substrate-binding domain-containing protein [Mesorhizobium soli]MDH6234954.1 octopine/nopaline transport system substrate-binding protein [Mesorhizobium soli]
MKLKVFSLLAFLAAGVSGSLAAEGELSIGTEGAYPPWSMSDAAGNVTGFDADVGALLCAKLDKKCHFVVQAFDGLIPALKAKRFDVIISGMSITADRKKEINFSVGYAELANMFVAPKDSDLVGIKDIDTLLKSLDGKKVGVQAGTTHAHFLEKRVPGADLRTYDTLDQMQIDLATGRIDTAFADLSALQDFLAKPDGQNFQLVDVKIQSTFDPSLGEGIGVGIAQDNTALKADIDKALCELVADGSIGKASEKWFKSDISLPCH